MFTTNFHNSGNGKNGKPLVFTNKSKLNFQAHKCVACGNAVLVTIQIQEKYLMSLHFLCSVH